MNLAPTTALPRGFGFAATNCGLRKPPNLDLGLILAERPVGAAGVFTRNLVSGRARSAFAEPPQQAAIANSRGNREFAKRQLCDRRSGHGRGKSDGQEVAREIGCEPEQVLVCSTGVIGVPLRVEKILAAVPGLTQAAPPGRRGV